MKRVHARYRDLLSGGSDNREPSEFLVLTLRLLFLEWDLVRGVIYLSYDQPSSYAPSMVVLKDMKARNGTRYSRSTEHATRCRVSGSTTAVEYTLELQQPLPVTRARSSFALKRLRGCSLGQTQLPSEMATGADCSDVSNIRMHLRRC